MFMSANKHTIYLTKKHKLIYNNENPSNVLMFSENGRVLTSKWLKKTLEEKDGAFIIMDHNNAILKETEKCLKERSYYIEKIGFINNRNDIRINPFDLVQDTSEIHYMFLSFLYAMWDNTDNDIPAMSNLIDAFASCVFFMFANQTEKRNMETLKKMIYSVRATCKTPDGVVCLSDAIFAGIKDQESMPCKYYAQFKKAAGDRQEEIGEKVARVFDMLTESDIQMMMTTDDSLADSFNFKTAIFINSNNSGEEYSAKIMFILLNYFIQKIDSHEQVLYVIDNLTPNKTIINLPYWMKTANQYNSQYIVCCDDLSGFKESPRTEKFFKKVRDTAYSSVLIHKNDMDFDDINNWNDSDHINPLESYDFAAMVIIPSENINELDRLF